MMGDAQFRGRVILVMGQGSMMTASGTRQGRPFNHMLNSLTRGLGIALLGVVFLGTGVANAQDPTLTERTDFLTGNFRAAPINPRTPRALGMGNAFVAVGGSYDSMFYNPAGLVAIRDWQFSILGLRAEANTDSFTFAMDAKDLSGGDANEANTFFAGRVGEAVYVNADNVTHFVMPYRKNWAFGFAYSYSYRFDGVVQPGITAGDRYIVGLRKLEDHAGYLTVARRIWGEYLDMGVNLKFISRSDIRTAESESSVTANNGVSYTNDFVKPLKGPGDFAAGADAGLVMRLPFSLLIPAPEDEDPSPWGISAGYIASGFTFQDIARTAFKAQQPDVANGILVAGSGDVPMTVDWGLAVAVPFEVARLTFAVDVRDINRDEIPLGHKYSVGLELAFRYVLSLRGGINANGYAAGIETRFGAVRLNGEILQERNTSIANNLKETRVSAGMSLGWPYL